MNHPYDIEKYRHLLRTDLVTLSAVASVLAVLLIGLIVYTILQIRKNKTKKLPYISLLAIIAVAILLSISMTSSIRSLAQDVSEGAYIAYEGTVNVCREKWVLAGGIPTSYDEYRITFWDGGEQVTLTVRKDPGFAGDAEGVYLVYTKHSNRLLEIER